MGFLKALEDSLEGANQVKDGDFGQGSGLGFGGFGLLRGIGEDILLFASLLGEDVGGILELLVLFLESLI